MSVESWLARVAVDVPAPVIAPRSRRTQFALAAGVLAALVGAMLPLLQVVSPGWWVMQAILIAALVLGAGFGARTLRLPGIAVAAIEAAVWLVCLTAMFAGPTAIAVFIPTPATFSLAPGLVSAAFEEIRVGAAPLDAGYALTFLIVAAIGALAVAIDHVVLTARMPLLAGVGLVAVSVIPSIAVPGELDLASFLLLGGSILFLLRTDTRARHRTRDAAEPAARASATASPIAGATATALGIAVVAVVVAVVVAPLLPAPVARVGGGGIGGSGASIDPTLELGDDLRQPRELEVLSVRSNAASPPYLRAVTLSQFDGAVWLPDSRRAVPLDSPAALPPLEVDPDIEVREVTTTVEVEELSSPWLPVAYPATAVTGLEGDWEALPYNRTVVSDTTTTSGQLYEVTSSVPRPTLEQIRAIDAADARPDTLELPGDMPEIIGETAREITAGAANDYDALLALQAWFRGPDFAYSLDAPVDDGFDGTGADAVADFLEQREGYCVHFASAFALMARTLDMPSRIVVGYLPGSATSAQSEGQTIYTVTSGQLHAWPEVHFPGVGWVSFEPTKSLGVPTSYSAGSTPSDGSTNNTAPEQNNEPTTAPTPTATPSASAGGTTQAGSAGGGFAGSGTPSPLLGIGLLVLAALVTPVAVREVRRRRMLAAADGGDVGAAWTTVQEQAVDLGIPVPAAESPRAFGTRLVREHGAPAEATEALVRAIERESYADDAARRAERFSHGSALSDAVTAVRAGMRAAAGAGPRMLAVAVPRSLFVRPGSAYAGSRSTATASPAR